MGKKVEKDSTLNEIYKMEEYRKSPFPIIFLKKDLENGDFILFFLKER